MNYICKDCGVELKVVNVETCLEKGMKYVSYKCSECGRIILNNPERMTITDINEAKVDIKNKEDERERVLAERESISKRECIVPGINLEFEDEDESVCNSPYTTDDVNIVIPMSVIPGSVLRKGVELKFANQFLDILKNSDLEREDIIEELEEKIERMKESL